MQDHQTSPRTVELWIRTFAPAATGPTCERAVQRAVDLKSAETVETVSIDVWGSVVERTTLSRHVPQLERIERRLEAFEEWAARNDRRLDPFFRRRSVESTITGESHEIWRLPTVAIAEFDEDGLVHVAPSRDGDRTIDVGERLDALSNQGSSGRVIRFDGDRSGHTGDGVISESDREETDRRSTRRRPVGDFA